MKDLTRANALRREAELQRRKPGTDGGIALYEQAVALFRSAGDPLRLAHAIRHLGDVYAEQGKPGLAEPCFDEALALYRAHPAPPPLDLANAIRSKALLTDETALWSEAAALYELARVEVGAAEARARAARVK